MAYTYEQLVQAYTALHVGKAPDAATADSLNITASLNASGQISDAQVLSNLVNGADNSTAVAVLAYQFFTGKSPSASGLTYLVNSAINTADLNDPYYAKLSLENRYINFAANLGIQGEGATAFATKYGSMSYSDYVASIYQTIVGSSYATAAGIDPAAAIASIISRKDAILATAQSAGMIPANATAAQIDIALKAATAGYLMGEAIKADVGLYAAAADNFMIALAQGTAVYNTDITFTYKPSYDSDAHGTGHAVDRAPVNLPGAPVTVPTVSAHAFVLTPGTDNFIGDVLADTYAGTDTTLTAGDVLNGGQGADSLTITAAATFTVPSVTVSNIETVTINGAGAVTIDTRGWTGVNTLSATAVGGATVSSGATTDVTVTNSAGGNTTQEGGHNVVLNVTGTVGSFIAAGTGTFATGDVTVNVDTADSTNNIYAAGAGNVSITQTTSNAVNTTANLASITVNGGASTNSVVIRNAAAATADGTHAGVVDNSVSVSDGASSGGTGVIPLVDIDGYATSLDIYGKGLTTLKLAHGSDDVLIHNSGSSVTTLALTLNAVTASTFTDANVYTTMNITTGATASSIGTLTDAALTTLTIAGASQLTIGDTSNTNINTVTITGAAGLVADLTQSFSVTSVDTTGTTGTSTLTLNGGSSTFTGGAGADNITLINNNVGHTISLGGGDDSVTLASGVTLPGTAITGGLGTDTLVMRAADAATASGSGAFAGRVSGFEHLTLTAAGAQTIDLATLGGYQYVTTFGGNGLTLNGYNSGGTLALTGTGTSYAIDATNFGGGGDSFNIKLSDGSNTGPFFASGGIGLAGVETVNITTADTQATPSGGFYDHLSLTAPDVQTLTVSGNAGLSLVASGTAVTSVDASGITLGGFAWTAGTLAGAVTINGSATGTNTIDVVNATNGVTYTGGSGSDNITVGSGANTIDVKADSSVDKVTILGATTTTDYTTINNLATGDVIDVSGFGGLTTTSYFGTFAANAGNWASVVANLTNLSDGTYTVISFITYGSDTYIIEDRSPSATFDPGVDVLVKLTGVTIAGGNYDNATHLITI